MHTTLLYARISSVSEFVFAAGIYQPVVLVYVDCSFTV
jgi:hypothetical protein